MKRADPKKKTKVNASLPPKERLCMFELDNVDGLARVLSLTKNTLPFKGLGSPRQFL